MINKVEMLNKLKKYRWIMYVLVVLAYMMTIFHRMTPAIMGPELMKDLQIGAVAFGFLGLAYTWTYAIGQAPIGTLLDQIGARRGEILLLVIGAVGCLVFSLAHSFAVLVIGRVLIGVSVTGFLIGGAKIISAWFTSKEYPYFWGLFMGLGALGGIFAATPLQALMTEFGWRGAVLVICGISIILAILIACLLKDHPSEKGLASPDELVGEAVSGPKTVQVEREDWKVSLKAVLSMAVVWLIGLLSLGVNSSAQTLQSLWNGIYLTDVYNFSKPLISNIQLWASIGLVVGCFLSGWVARAINMARTMVLGIVCFLVFWLYMTFKVSSLSVPELMMVNFVFGFAQMLTIATTFSFIKENVPNMRLGTAMGVINSFAWIFGAGLFQQLWGFIIKGISGGVRPYPANAFQAAFWVQVVVLVIGLICALYLWRAYSSPRQE